MWLLYLLTLCNAALNQHTVINVYRIELGFVLIGIFEVLALISLIYSLVKGGEYAAQYPTLRTSPVLILVMSLYIAGFAAGLLGGLLNSASPKDLLVNMREYAMYPLYMFVGYRMLGTPRSGEKFIYALALAGVITSIMLFISFGENAEFAGRNEKYSLLRTVSYIANYASIGATLMFFLIVSDLKLMPYGLAVLVGCICVVGSFANFSRTVILTLAIGMLTLVPILPRHKLGKIAIRSLILVPLGFGCLYLGLFLASHATGRDFFDRFNQMLISMMPWAERGIHGGKAWDSRLPSILIELKMWATSPVWGNGFAAQAAMVAQGGWDAGGFYHNAWSGTLATTGLLGFTALVLTMGAPIVIGYRMVKSRLDRPTMVMGGLAYIVGINGVVTATCTMIFTTRGALIFALIAGMAFRARAMAEATAAMRAGELDGHSEPLDMLEETYINGEDGLMHPVPMPITEPEALAHFHRL